MIQITYICDKCSHKETKDYETIPTKRGWMGEIRQSLRTVYVDEQHLSVCSSCYSDWKSIKKEKDKEVKENYFPKTKKDK